MALISTLMAQIFTALFALFQLLPYLVVVNSVPGSMPLTPAEYSALTEQRTEERPEIPLEVMRAFSARYAGRELRSWQDHGKGSMPRAILAKLLHGRDIEEANQYLQACTPWSVPGSTWRYNHGDYDFTEVILTSLLYLVGDQPEILYPETQAHLLEVLLLEEGGRPHLKVPNTGGRLFDTENHILMTETSRYLKNQWLRRHGSEESRHDNRANGHEVWLLAHLNHLRHHGFFEFNSVPYKGYALHPIMNLEAFAEAPEVAALAREILDHCAWANALGTLSFRQNAPFRRQPQYIGDMRVKSLYDLPDMMEIWCADENTDPSTLTQGGSHTFIASVLPYRPTRTILEWAKHKPAPYFLVIGHPVHAAPEIYSGGPGYLLSAGGAWRGYSHQVIPRPTALLLDDGASSLEGCFYIDPGPNVQQWNNTGVHRNFACGAGPIRVPEGKNPVLEKGAWAIYAPAEAPGLLLATYSTETLGLLILAPDAAHDPEALLTALLEKNGDEALLHTQFTFPDGAALGYDLNATAGTWVMTEENGAPLDRDYDAWKLTQEFRCEDCPW